MSQAQEKVYKCEKIVNDYKEGLYALECNPNLNSHVVNRLKTELLYKERELMDK